MLAFKCILVPTDLTENAAGALRHALALARHTGAELHLLYVMEEGGGGKRPGLPQLNSVYDRLKEAVSVELRLSAGAGSQSGLQIEQHVERGVSAAPAILDYAEQHDVDLIVMGTRGRQGGERFLIGSTAERVVRFARCPVLTVGPGDGHVPGLIKRILVPVDFSEHAAAALKQAKILANHFEAHLDLLHVVEPIVQPVFYGDDVAGFELSAPRLEEKGRAELKRLYEKTKGPSGPWRAHVVRGQPARAIAAFARDYGTHLIVQSSHGLTGLGYALLGSVAEKVVRLAPCPVLTFKAAGTAPEAERHAEDDEIKEEVVSDEETS